MLTKLRTLASLYRELGLRWSAFRLAYAFRLRTGLIRLQMPPYQWSDRPLETWLKKDGHVRAESSRPILPIPTELPANVSWNPQTAIDEADRLLHGEIKYFAHEFHQTGFPPNWYKDYFSDHVTLSDSEGSLTTQNETLRSRQSLPHTVPASLRESDKVRHWSQISDDSGADIKFIWEPNRFSFVYTLVRAYAVTQDTKYAEAFWQSIFNWAENNPPNTGPNWMDGQEIALRLMAWTFGYYQFSNSPSVTPQRKAQFIQFVAGQAERIHKNIDYAISTRSNHTISEAFGLWLIGLHFPELKDSEKYLSLGRELLEQEAAAQIFPDGGYSMYSLNYHRFILHIYLYAIRLGEINNVPFSDSLYSSISASIEYLSHLIDPQTGRMPVYGSNDGALVLPLNNCDFTDYRPLLQLGWYITKKEFLFEPGAWDEDVFWLCGERALIPGPSPAGRRESESPSPAGRRESESPSPAGRRESESPASRGRREPESPASRGRREPESPSPTGRGVRGEGESSFPHAGVYLLRGSDSKAIIRCTDFRARPSHADQLHVDLWIHGHNIACDAGTYLYSGNGRWRNGLAHTSAHNTVAVDGKDQMTLVSRFTWVNWSKGKVLQHNERIWQGEHDSYKPVSHRRTVMALDDDRWLVLDHLSDGEPHHYALHWLLDDFRFEQKDNSILMSLNGMNYRVRVGLTEGDGKFSIVRADPNSTRGWRSRYYGHKQPAISLMLEANQPQVTFWTFFGFENDVVELEGKVLKINSREIPLVE